MNSRPGQPDAKAHSFNLCARYYCPYKETENLKHEVEMRSILLHTYKGLGCSHTTFMVEPVPDKISGFSDLVLPVICLLHFS